MSFRRFLVLEAVGVVVLTAGLLMMTELNVPNALTVACWPFILLNIAATIWSSR